MALLSFLHICLTPWLSMQIEIVCDKEETESTMQVLSDALSVSHHKFSDDAMKQKYFFGVEESIQKVQVPLKSGSPFLSETICFTKFSVQCCELRIQGSSKHGRYSAIL
ncbi:hypothetical protein HAX54_009903 [Datura stramonium]|uniref:Uncharacterized protein n=1 Tax=Datura stramonium TaxID=4076 RepID=A0ABS8RYW0_DATST|nr:hypothetical protein [Datura stramonium]